MADDNNVIDLFSLRQAQIKKHQQDGVKKTHGFGTSEDVSKHSMGAADVVDMTEAREAIMSQERRIAKRTILTEFVGVFVVIPQHGLCRVTLYDISESGISFDVDEKLGQFQSGEKIAIRVYLSHNSYFPFVVKITNVRQLTEEPVIRHGSIIEEAENEEALYHFMKFVESVSMSLHRDQGDLIAPSGRR